MNQTLFGPPHIHRTAVLSKCGQLRFTLSREWHPGERVCFIGLNPSTADAVVDDPTVKRWMHFAEAWGYGGFVAVNLYPFRTSSPKECQQWSDFERNGPDWYARDAICENIEIVAKEAKKASLVVACWGANPWDEFLIAEVLERICLYEEPHKDIYCFGVTSGGQPIHPMARGKHRIADTARPVLWRAA